jgi:ribosomal-protein-alanine N-acetyltransferase
VYVGGRVLSAMQPTLARWVGEYLIRPCREEDIPSVIAINLVSLPEHYSDYFFEELRRESPETFLVAEKDGQVVGYIMCRIEYGFSNLKRFNLVKKGHIVSIAVLEGHRGKGIGTALLEEAIKAMAKKKCAEAYLEVRVSNVGAISLYKRLGFTITSKIEFYYRDGEAAYVMTLPLDRESVGG